MGLHNEMKKKTVKKKSIKKETVSYVIEITDWDFSYSFAVNQVRKLIDGPFWEHSDLKVKGKLLQPEKFIDKEIEVTIMASRRDTIVMNKPEDYHKSEPTAVGMMTVRGKQSELLCWLPFDAFQPLCTMFNAGKVRYIILGGQALYHGSADIVSMRFQSDYGKEDIE
jgi:hypothetical protein